MNAQSSAARCAVPLLPLFMAVVAVASVLTGFLPGNQNALRADTTPTAQGKLTPKNFDPSNPNQQFMCWADGECLTLRWAIKGPSAPHFKMSVPQGINPKQLLLDVTYNPIAAPERVHVGEYTLPDYGYDSVHIQSLGVTVPVLRSTSAAIDCQALCYVQCGVLVTQIRTPQACRISLCRMGTGPLHLSICVCPQTCLGLPKAEYAVCDTGDQEVLVSNPLIQASMILPVLR